MKKSKRSNPVSRRWLPNEKKLLRHWHGIIMEAVEAQQKEEIHPVIKEFQALLDDDPVVRMLMTQMIQQIPAKYKDYHPKSVHELLMQLNAVLTVAPPYIKPGKSEAAALVGTPFSAILIWTMGTTAGFAAYRNAAINGMFKKLLRVWTGFLDSEESAKVLVDTPTGWQSKAARKQLNMQDYIYDPKAPYWGFSSWNAFFTREVKPGKRPIHGKDDPSVVVSACDCAVYRPAQKIKTRRKPFWVKAQPYSIADMLDNNYVENFLGGYVWQAFLNPFNYHRWHSPVAGTVQKAYVKEGLYFSQADSEGQDPTDQDHSEGYITHVQTRALIFIKADNPAIGMVCVMPVGMVEISSCVINEHIKPGARVEKGQELGYFQFGGSTHCVVFQPGAIKKFKVNKTDQSVKFGEVIAIANTEQ